MQLGTKVRTYIAPFIALALLTLLPSIAFADGTASIAGLTTDTTVGVGTTVSFTVLTAGFTNPMFNVVDSFGGGVSNVNINSFGDLSWTPNNSDIGSHTITITVTDSQGDTAAASQTINVVAPTVSIDALSPGSTVGFGNTLTFSISGVGFISPQYSVADSYPYSTLSSANLDNAGNFHWTPVYQDIGSHTLTITARDYQGHLATVQQQITVTGLATVSIGPVSPSTTVHIGDNVSFNATTTGYTNPAYSVADAFTSSLGTSTLAVDSNGKVTWKPNSNDIGAHIITVSVSDSSGNSSSVKAIITVVPGVSAVITPVVMYVAPTSTTPLTTSATIQTGTPYVFKTLLMVGSTGVDVTALQNLLATLGFFTVTPTGYFGAVTKAALQKYQAAHGIDTVGYTGPMTRASLSTGK